MGGEGEGKGGGAAGLDVSGWLAGKVRVAHTTQGGDDAVL